jgi:hypothetical protein
MAAKKDATDAAPPWRAWTSCGACSRHELHTRFSLSSPPSRLLIGWPSVEETQRSTASTCEMVPKNIQMVGESQSTKPVLVCNDSTAYRHLRDLRGLLRGALAADDPPADRQTDRHAANPSQRWSQE